MRLITVLLLVLLSPSLAHAQEAKESAYDRVMRTGVLRCGFIPWPPGFEVDPNTNEVRGPTKELFQSIITLTGWKVEFVQTALGNNALDLNNGRIDAMCADGPWTITSIKFVDYTTWVAYSPVMVYVRQDNEHLKDFAALNDKGVTFAAIDGDVSMDLARLRFPEAKQHALINLTDPAQMLTEVATGKADAVILDPVTAESYIKNNPDQIKAVANGQALAVYPIGMSVARGEAALQQTLSRASEMAINLGIVDKQLDLYDASRRTIYSPLPAYKAP